MVLHHWCNTNYNGLTTLVGIPAVLVEVQLTAFLVMVAVVDTPVETDRPLIVFLLVEEDHSISIQTEQNHLDGFKMVNVKSNLYVNSKLQKIVFLNLNIFFRKQRLTNTDASLISKIRRV